MHRSPGATPAAGSSAYDPTPRATHGPPLECHSGSGRGRAEKQRVQPAFGIIKCLIGSRQFIVRGPDKVRGDWILVCLAWNLKRIAALRPELRQSDGNTARLPDMCIVCALNAPSMESERAFVRLSPAGCSARSSRSRWLSSARVWAAVGWARLRKRSDATTRHASPEPSFYSAERRSFTERKVVSLTSCPAQPNSTLILGTDWQGGVVSLLGRTSSFGRLRRVRRHSFRASAGSTVRR